MKKIILFIAAIMLIMPFPSVISSAESRTSEDVRYTEALYLLEALGINHFSKSDSEVTYSKFNDALSVALNTKNTYLNIKELTGVTFSSETGAEFMTYDDAVRSLVNITGYKLGAKAMGGTAAAYVNFASTKDILKGVDVKLGEAITARDAAVMLYNALDVDVLQAVYTGSETEYKSFEGETLLYKYRKIRKGKGIIEANEYTSFYSDSNTAAGSVRINGTDYRDPNEYAADLIAHAVKFYYYDDGDDYELFAVYCDRNKESEIVIDGNFSYNSGRRVYYYNDNNREEYEDIPGSAAIIYNGVALSEYDNSIFDFTNRHAILIDNDNDGKTDAVIIKEYTDMYVTDISTEHGIIYDGLGKEELDVNGDRYNRIRIFDSEGKKINIYSISAGDVLSVYKSSNNMLMDIYVSTNQITGRIEGTDTENNRIYITIGGEKYRLSSSFENFEIQNVVNGTSAGFYLNIHGEIVYMKQLEAIMKYGYIMNKSLTSESDDKLWIKLLSEDGRIYSYSVKEKARIDGQSYKKLQDALFALNDASALIRYDINENNEIFIIDTDKRGQKETDETLSSFGSKQNLTYIAAAATFSGRLKVGDNTKVFFCPAKTEDHNGYGVALNNADMLKSSSAYDVQGFGCSSTNYIPDVIVIDAPISNYFKVDKLSKSYVIADIATVANDEGEAVTQLTVFNKITQSVILCSDPTVGANEDLHVGDVINAALDNKGNFCDIVKTYDSKTHTLIDSDVIDAFRGADYTSRCRMISGYVCFNGGTTLGLSQNAPDADNPPSKGELEYIKVNDSVGVIVDSKYDEDDPKHIRRAFMGEVKDYLTYKNCANVFARADQGSLSFIVIYQ